MVLSSVLSDPGDVREWINTCSSIVGSLSLVALIVFVRKYMRRPKLLIELSDPISNVTPTAPDGRPVRYYHLTVQNSGKTNARGCLARLMSVEKQREPKSAEFDRVKDAHPCALHWRQEPVTEMRTYDRVDIFAGESKDIDLCTQEPATPDIMRIFRTPHHPDGIRDAYDLGVYRLLIRVTAENADKVDFRLTVRIPGGEEAFEIIAGWPEPAVPESGERRNAEAR